MLSETNQPPKGKSCMRPLREVSGTVTCLETGTRRVAPWAGRGGRGLLFNQFRASVWEDGKILEIDGGIGCTKIDYT